MKNTVDMDNDSISQDRRVIPTIGVSIIAKNEADRIGRCIESVGFADEVIVVDSGSDDGTPDICRKLGATVIFNEWRGYAAQKQFAMTRMTADWVLSLDADEAISPELAVELKEAVGTAGNEISAFSMPRLTWYLGRWIRHSGWYPDRKVRLVRNGKGRWEGVLHERLIVEGGVGRLVNPMYHFTYRGIVDHINTVNSFSDVWAAERGPEKGWFVVAGVFHALGKFLECFIWKRGFLDGLPGLVIAMNSSWYVFVRHAKAWEHYLNREKTD